LDTGTPHVTDVSDDMFGTCKDDMFKGHVFVAMPMAVPASPSMPAAFDTSMVQEATLLL
jgi:hypothetical protein